MVKYLWQIELVHSLDEVGLGRGGYLTKGGFDLAPANSIWRPIFFSEETCPAGHDGVEKLVRYYYDDIAAEILTRSFHLFPVNARREFLDNDRVPLADLRPDLKAQLTEFLNRRARKGLHLAS